jgi:AraC family L-rhamnose operon regulatory protein RhaS
MTVPTYRDRNGSFEADTCKPLVDAVARNEVVLEALARGHYPGCRLPAGELAGLKSAGYWDAKADQTWGLGWHRNEGIEITYLETGKLAFAAEGSDYMLQADSMTLTRPWQRHRVGNPHVTSGKLHWIILDVGVRHAEQSWRWPSWIMLSAADRRDLTRILRQTEQAVWPTSGEMRHCFHTIATAVQSAHISALTIRINELLLLLLEYFRESKPKLRPVQSTAPRTIELFLNEFEHHPEYLAQDWSVEKMAAECGLKTTQFVHWVRQLTNQTPVHYLNHCRLEHAARLLRQRPEVSVTEIAQTCGFSSSQYFATVFGKRYGCAPGLYREKQRTADGMESKG